ncbi:MAG: neutral zinc metallopeptidase [Cryobacterium sp.]|nr:neutral zinc metallopeptidase [Cryobacterium sp.]MCC7128701.1 neutral zinc metallopeptidase [Microbacteriaceae bacterium]
MTFNPDSNIGGGKISQRGRGAGLAVGGGGILALILAIASPLLGVDLTPLSGMFGGDSGQSQVGPVDNLKECQTGADANSNVACLMKGAAASLDAYWSGMFAREGITYRSPADFVLFTGSTSTGCGTASSATGPFYCPNDETIYVDTSFFDELRTQFGANGGPLAEMYVVAHEWGHHIQNVLGTMDNLNLQATGPESDSVRLELQADCYGGSWAKDASTVPDSSGVPFLQPITQDQINDALNAASVIGDDRIQEQATGQVNPESWTHGSSAERVKWFSVGFKSGPTACNTFSGDL